MKSWTEKKSSSLPIVFIIYPECQQSQLALGVGFSIGSKTDGTKVCPETCLWITVANKEVQMAEFKGLLKEKSTFKGNEWGKMPARWAAIPAVIRVQEKTLGWWLALDELPCRTDLSSEKR